MYPIKFIVFNVLNILDIVTTLKGKSIGIRELNPLINVSLNHPILFIALKLTLIGVVSYIIYIKDDDKHPKMQEFLGEGLIVVYGLLLLNNLFSIAAH